MAIIKVKWIIMYWYLEMRSSAHNNMYWELRLRLWYGLLMMYPNVSCKSSSLFSCACMLSSAICKQKLVLLFDPTLCTIDIRYMKCRNCETDLDVAHMVKLVHEPLVLFMKINLLLGNGLNIKILCWNHHTTTLILALASYSGRAVGSCPRVLGSNLGRDIGFADWCFCGFPQSLQEMPGSWVPLNSSMWYSIF